MIKSIVTLKIVELSLGLSDVFPKIKVCVYFQRANFVSKRYWYSLTVGIPNFNCS